MSDEPRTVSILGTVLALFLALPTGTARGQETEPILQVGVTGSTPSTPSENPTYMLGSTDVQRLMLEIAERPKPRREIEAVIADESFTVEDMVAVGLLREEGGLYRIDFNLLRVADQQEIIEVSEPLGRDLARAVLARRDELETLAATHGQPGVGPGEVLYIVLGCFSLDWDGLALTEELGYRDTAQRTLGGRSFTPWAKEHGAEVSLRGLYWGSHNQERTDFTFTTFGDHHTHPRFGLPDMLWNSGAAVARYEEHPDGRRAAARMLAAYRADAFDDIARVMRSLRSRDLAEAELAAETGLVAAKLGPILDLLESADYVARDGETVRARAVVLTAADRDMVRALLAQGRDIMVAWHERNYGPVRARLSELTPLRNGVPFERVYTEIWHFVFGIANRTLVEEGLFADPYAEGRRHRGFLPAIWANGLDEIS